MPSTSLRTICSGRFVFGLLVVAIGVLVTLDNLNVLDAERFLRYWPAGLILVGLAQVVQACSAGGRVSGGIWMFVGTWLLLETFEVVHVSVWALWPLVLVVIGLSLVWRALSPSVIRPVAADTGGTISAFAMMSGVERASASPDFRGGDLTAIMGGVEVDLRRAAIAGDEAVIDVFAMWGGLKLRVPETWAIVNKVVPFLGGVEQKARGSSETGAPRLVIRGSVVMGGVEIAD